MENRFDFANSKIWKSGEGNKGCQPWRKLLRKCHALAKSCFVEYAGKVSGVDRDPNRLPGGVSYWAPDSGRDPFFFPGTSAGVKRKERCVAS